MNESSSVLKNRITGYSNINSLKHKSQPFHMNHHHDAISKNTLSDLITDTKNKIHTKEVKMGEEGYPASSTSQAFVNPSLPVGNQPYKTMQDSRLVKNES